MPEQQPMTRRAMAALGGAMTAGVAAVLGLTLVLGPGGATARRAAGPPAERIAAGSVAVPPLVGLDSMAATGRLAEHRLGVAGLIRVPSSRPAGQVIRSYPRTGAAVAAGGQVTLYVSVGQGGAAADRRVTVPYFAGMDAQQARGVAAQLGLRVTVRGGGSTVGGQSPPPGAMVPRGSAVRFDLR